jgi:intergrase/recombinase
MTRRKGELTSRRKLREWPHAVTLVVPELGFGTRLNEIVAFARNLDHQRISRAGRGGPDLAIWCFKRAEDAAAFAVRFGGESG